jgi:TP901 family phage tail tape measure protein
MASRFSIEATFKGNDQITKVMNRIEGGVSGFSSRLGKKLESVDKVTSKLAGSMWDLGKKAATAGLAVGAALGAAAYNVGKAGADFEQAMASVGAVSLMTRAEVKDLEQAALQYGASTKFSATQVAGGMELMGKAGFTNAQILQGIGPILSAAAAEGAEFEEVAGHVSNLLKGMGLETTEAGRVADVLTLASARTNSSISSLGESMANVSATARQFKIPLEQAVASVALLQDVGIDASTAGSAVNTMLTNMANPSKKAKEAMVELGVSFTDVHGDMLPLTQVFSQFEKAAKKSGGNMKQVAFFAELVGLRGQKAALNLEKLFSEGKFGDLVKELDGAAGSAKKMADLRMQTLTGDLTMLGNVVDTVKISLYDTASGPLRSIVRGTTEWLQANKDLIKSRFVEFLSDAKFGIELFASGAKSGFKSVSAAFAPVVWLLGVFGRHIEDSSTWPVKVHAIGEAFGFLGGVAIAFLAFAAAVKVARGAVWAYEAAVIGAKGAVWAWNVATTAYTLATDGALAATVLQTAAQWAGRAAMLAGTIATGARNVVTYVAFAATTRFTFAQVASKLATVAATAATWLWNTATGAWTAVTVIASNASIAFRGATVLSTEATGAATAATNLANVSMGTFLLTVGAAAAAVGSLYAAYKQFSELLDVSGGWGGLKAGLDSVAGGGSFFEGIDNFQNRQAEEAAAAAGGAPQAPAVGPFFGPAPTPADSFVAPPQVASPTQAITNSVQTNHATAEVTVKAHPGTSAAVTKKPKGGSSVNVAPSGGM